MPLSVRAETVIHSLVSGKLAFTKHALEHAHFDKATAEDLADSYKKGFAQNGVFFFDEDYVPTQQDLISYYGIKPKPEPEAPKKKPEEFSDEFAARKKKYSEALIKHQYQVAKKNIRIATGKRHLAAVNNADAKTTDADIKKLVITAFLLQPKKYLKDYKSGTNLVIEGPIPDGFYGMVRLPGNLLVEGYSWLWADAMRVIVPQDGNALVITAYPVSYDEALHS